MNEAKLKEKVKNQAQRDIVSQGTNRKGQFPGLRPAGPYYPVPVVSWWSPYSPGSSNILGFRGSVPLPWPLLVSSKTPALPHGAKPQLLSIFLLPFYSFHDAKASTMEERLTYHQFWLPWYPLDLLTLWSADPLVR